MKLTVQMRNLHGLSVPVFQRDGGRPQFVRTRQVNYDIRPDTPITLYRHADNRELIDGLKFAASENSFTKSQIRVKIMLHDRGLEERSFRSCSLERFQSNNYGEHYDFYPYVSANLDPIPTATKIALVRALVGLIGDPAEVLCPITQVGFQPQMAILTGRLHDYRRIFGEEISRCVNGQSLCMSFDGLDLSGMDFSRLVFYGTTFGGIHTNLRGVNASGSTFVNGHFCEAQMQGADFSGAAFINNPKFYGANISGTNLDNAFFGMSDAPISMIGRGIGQIVIGPDDNPKGFERITDGGYRVMTREEWRRSQGRT